MNIFEKLFGSFKMNFLNRKGSFRNNKINIKKSSVGIVQQSSESIQNVIGEQPTVDVSIIFDKNVKRTIFQFIKTCKVPVLVWIRIGLKINDSTAEGEKELEKYLKDDNYLMGKKEIDLNLTDTALAPSSDFGRDFFENLILQSQKGKKVEVVLNIDIAPAFNKNARSFFQQKSYRFYPEKEEWIRTPFWGIPEQEYPFNKYF